MQMCKTDELELAAHTLTRAQLTQILKDSRYSKTQPGPDFNGFNTLPDLTIFTLSL